MEISRCRDTIVGLIAKNWYSFYRETREEEMPIMSYLAYPAENKKRQLASAFNSLPECEVVPATNKDLMILVTDTKDDREEEELQKKLAKIPYLASLALVSAHSD